MRQETMPAVIQTRKGVEKHIDTHRLTPQNWGVGPPEFSHQKESFLLRQTPSCFTAGPGFTLDFSRPAWAPVLLPVLFPFVTKSVLSQSRDLGRAPKCSARSPSPRSGKKTPQNNATCNSGIYYWLEPGPPALTKGVRMKGPEPQFSRVFIGYNY